MVPAVFITLESFPLNPNGKIDRKALPAPVGDYSGPAAGFVAPRSPMEKRLTEIWSEVFGQKQIGISDNFFELGGHSLLAIRVINGIKKIAQRKPPAAHFFRNPTIEGIAHSLEQEKTKLTFNLN
ncbi:MAG: phosphopantetheine-binding protein [Limisphaerales bacterium]